MTTLRTDFTAAALTALVIVAAVVLTVSGHPVPDWLPGLGALTGAYGVGAALPTRLPLAATPTTPAGENELRSVGQAVIPAPAAAAESTPLPPVAPLVTPAWPAGRDVTETFPAITPAMIAADQAARA